MDYRKGDSSSQEAKAQRKPAIFRLAILAPRLRILFIDTKCERKEVKGDEAKAEFL